MIDETDMIHISDDRYIEGLLRMAGYWDAMQPVPPHTFMATIVEGVIFGKECLCLVMNITGRPDGDNGYYAACVNLKRVPIGEARQWLKDCVARISPKAKVLKEGVESNLWMN